MVKKIFEYLFFIAMTIVVIYQLVVGFSDDLDVVINIFAVIGFITVCRYIYRTTFKPFPLSRKKINED